jgi:hypothetical protein
LRKFWRWEFRTYKQVWLAAPLGFGVPGFAISVAVGRSLAPALTYAASITVVGGAAQTYRLRRRRQREPR